MSALVQKTVGLASTVFLVMEGNNGQVCLANAHNKRRVGMENIAYVAQEIRNGWVKVAVALHKNLHGMEKSANLVRKEWFGSDQFVCVF